MAATDAPANLVMELDASGHTLQQQDPPNGAIMSGDGDQVSSVFVQFVSESGEESGSPVWLPVCIDSVALTQTVNTLLEKDESEGIIYNFFIGPTQILDTLSAGLTEARQLPGGASVGLEGVVRVIYQPQAVFRVRPVTRCTSTVPGHKGAVLVTLFSPDGKSLASGSGDMTVRFWDLDTELPSTTGTAHRASVLCLAWSPDGRRLASGCQAGQICLWQQQAQSDENGGQDAWVQAGRALIRPVGTVGKQWIRSLVWRPLHLDAECRLLAAAYQDGSVIVWDTISGQPQRTLSGHAKSVTCLRWGGTDLLYTASQDCTIKVWRAGDGVLCRTLTQHGHWVNTLALSTDYVLRTGAFDPAEATLVKRELGLEKTELQAKAQSIYNNVKRGQPERLVSGSDDNTLSLWQPEVEKRPLCPRMTGHQGVVNDVKFSPDARLIASASFDHSVKIWDGVTGQFLATLFGHVQEVYLVAWSGDSRLLVSASKDSTLKLWSVVEVRRWQGGRRQQTKRHLLHDLPGHADAVFAVDWSPDGQRVASGGKDRVMKMWRA